MEHLDILVVGAGLSGICAGHHVRAARPRASFAILEARGAIGGTWDLFRYPGIRSDSDMYTLGYAFRPWRGDDSIADGPSILAYIRDTADAEGLDRHVRFHHRVVRAEWSTAESRWTVTVERGDPGTGAPETVRLTCGFLFSCTGYYRYDHGYLPEFPGRERFRGPVVHPQEWPADLDWAGRHVVVIGSGATAVTLVPALAECAAHVTMLQRSPTWIGALPTASPLARWAHRWLPERIAGTFLRWTKASMTQLFYLASRRRPGRVRRVMLDRLRAELPPGYDVATHFTPSYDPWDQRVCLAPDGDLFRAIREGRASVVTDHVETFTERGIRLRSGRELDADVIVTATGLDLLFIGGMALVVDGETLDVSQRLTFKGMMIEGVPNFAMAVGYTNASWTLKAELTCRAVGRLLAHMHRTGAAKVVPVNRGETGVEEPLLGLDSGYVRRAAGRFPRQGSRSPWRLHQSYLLDTWQMRLRGVVDDALVFSPPPDGPGPAARAGSGSAARPA